MHPMRELFIDVMKKKVSEDGSNPKKPSYQAVNRGILNLLLQDIPLRIETIHEEVMRQSVTMPLDRKVNPKRINTHIFVTDSNSCLNGTVQKLGYKLRQKDNRIIIQKINGLEEIAL
jgi:hypothetical protein